MNTLVRRLENRAWASNQISIYPAQRNYWVSNMVYPSFQYSVWWWNMLQSKMATITGVKCSLICTYFCVHTRVIRCFVQISNEVAMFFIWFNLFIFTTLYYHVCQLTFCITFETVRQNTFYCRSEIFYWWDGREQRTCASSLWAWLLYRILERH